MPGSTKKGKESGLEKIAAFIVDKRKAFYLIYILIAIFSIFSSGWVSVNNTLTDYLSEESETKQGLAIMDEEFITYATAKVMVDNVSYDKALKLSEELEEISGVKEVEFDDTTKHYTNGSAMFSVTFSGNDTDEVSQTALEKIKKHLSDYDLYVSAELGDTKAKQIEKEINLVMVIVCIIILLVLFFTSQTYMEIPVLIVTFGMAALLNKGTNYLFGTISFVSNSIAVVLQLALAIDYAIILCHRYTEERLEKDAHSAVVAALCKAIPEISGSCLTTLSGLAAMTFMHFRLGYDMGIILIKAIIISIVVVFTLMPGVLFSLSAYIDKTHHKNFVPDISPLGKIIVKLRIIAPCIFAVLLVAAFFLSNRCPYAYSYSVLSTFSKNESQIADELINETFSNTNTLAMLVPTGDYDKEKLLLSDLERFPEVDSCMGIANIEAMDGYCLADKLTPRQFAELTDMDVEKAALVYAAYAASNDSYGKILGGIDNYSVPLIDMFTYLYDQVQEGTVSLDSETKESIEDINDQLSDAKHQLKGEKYSRIVMQLNIPEESEETFAFLSTVKNTAKKYYPENVFLAGNSTNDYDLSSTFGQDNVLISVLSVLFVMIILLFTFQSAGLPIILILVIQGSVWMNFAFPAIRNQNIFFLSYLVVSSIQMGANIDYAIVITNRYTQLRQEGMHPFEAAIKALVQAFPTILTSGSILASAGIVIGLLSSDPAISSIGLCLGRGTIISIVLVMGILPQLLILGDVIIEKTSFSLKRPQVLHTGSGNMKIDGQVHGYVSGRLDGSFTGTINGQIDANIKNKESEAEENEQEDD